MYKGNEYAISTAFNYSEGNYPLKNITFQETEDRPIQLLLVAVHCVGENENGFFIKCA